MNKVPEEQHPAAERGIKIHNLAEQYIKGEIEEVPRELYLFYEGFEQLKEGYNDGEGTSELDRYQGNTDWYPIVGTLEYRDADDDFIDDYSVTFSVNMTGPYGNGDTDVNLNEYIRYTEAFLYNGLDEMFSVVSLPNPFDKNEASAYYISWTILSPIN